ncbi:integrase family protein [Acinetobacter sp. ME22]|uniref:tyrosine-type recombinase/integrase n=1 Tax=Acinetobacter sp. ME22 TaxID=2904802 RepID=UPI001EDC00A4|nr:integrase family protein [Acinetobacter sp. ME22]MCG2572375.1 integrase family protein [Acinetobacter sp. ME22]
MKLKFTTNKVQKLKKPEECKNQIFYWDIDTPGLSVRVTQNENRSYIFQNRVSGKSLRITIGDVNIWSLDDARKEARRLQQLCDQGIDPRRNKAEEDQKNDEFTQKKENSKITFGQVFLEYIEANKNLWSERHLHDHYTISHRGGEPKKRGHGLTIPGVLTPLLDIPLVQIDSDTLINWQNNESKTRPGRAALAFRLARTCINWCQEHEKYSELINAKVHQAKRVRRSVPVLKPVKNSVQRNQLKDWFLAVNDINNIMHRTFLQISILTGPRSESMRVLTYSQLDFKWKTISIWDKVEQEDRIIPMTPYVEQLLSRLPKHPQSDFVFWSEQSASGHITDIRKNYYRALEEKGLPKFTIHDLRRSFSNLAEWLDIPTGVVAQIMGHKPSATAEKHYKDRPVDLLRIHHTKIENWILEQAGMLEVNEKGT